MMEIMTSPTDAARPNTTHRLKTLPCYFAAVRCGDKLFEVRFNDRNYRVGDTLQLREWSQASGYSGESCRARVTYVLDNPEYLQPGFVVLGIALLPPPMPRSNDTNDGMRRDAGVV